MQQKSKGKRPLLWIAIIFLTVFSDQVTKYLAVRFLKPMDTVPIIKDALHLTYATNTGAAFGMLKDHRWVFLTVSTLAIIAMSIYLFKSKYRHPLFCLAFSFIVGGGIGNMIDRILLGYVVDFIDFRLINFAIFNTADSFVCIGCALAFVWVLFFSEKEDAVHAKINDGAKEGSTLSIETNAADSNEAASMLDTTLTADAPKTEDEAQ